MSSVQAKLFELGRLNVQLYQLRSRLERETDAGTTPDELDRLRTSIRKLDAEVGSVVTELDRLRTGGDSERTD
jgi:hypothetical protein